jgi:glycosyltransferase involved in cell wall biosynthesis
VPRNHDTTGPIAIFIASMSDGGAQRAMLKLAGGIASRGYPVDIVLAHADGPFLSEIPPSVRIVDLMSSRVLTSLPRLVAYLRRARPRALLSALGYVNVVAVWARAIARVDTRLAVSERNTLSMADRHASNLRSRLMIPLTRRFYPWADRIVAVSKGVADDLAQVAQIPRHRIDVVYNPIVTPELRAKARASLSHPWFESGAPPVVLAVGRLRPQKDFPSLIRAFAKVRAERPARLLILGEGSERPAIETLVSQLQLRDVVGVPGFVPNPYAYMTRAAAFVLSSRWEGLPGVLIEALYCGLPVVATDCPSGPREILAHGAYGTLVWPGDIDALAKGVDAVLAGGVFPAPPESWRPFELNTIVAQYLEILTGHAATGAASGDG